MASAPTRVRRCATISSARLVTSSGLPAAPGRRGEESRVEGGTCHQQVLSWM